MNKMNVETKETDHILKSLLTNDWALSVLVGSSFWSKSEMVCWFSEDTGAQPLVNEDGSLALAVNGEIYNHKVLRKHLKHPYKFKTHSDCEVIIPLVRYVGLVIETIDTERP